MKPRAWITAVEVLACRAPCAFSPRCFVGARLLSQTAGLLSYSHVDGVDHETLLLHLLMGTASIIG